LCLVELRGFGPLTPCVPCHPHHFTTPAAASPGTTSALLRKRAGRSPVVRPEAARGIAADNLLKSPETLLVSVASGAPVLRGQGPDQPAGLARGDRLGVAAAMAGSAGCG
jgi:hypothetical protein